MRWWRANWPLWLILAAALGLRLAAGAWWQGRLPPGERFGFGDSDSYWSLGRAIAEGKPYQYGDARIFRTPGYPLVLAPLFWLGGSDPPPAWAFIESALLGTAAVGGVYWLTRTLFDRRAALIAAAIAAVYPGAISQGALVLSEAPFMPLVLAEFALWSMAWRSESTSRAIWLSLATGLSAGLATLMRPSWLLFTPAAAVLSALVCIVQRSGAIAQPGATGQRSEAGHPLGPASAIAPDDSTNLSRGLKPTLRWRWRAAAISLVICLSLALTMLPWWIRNYQLTGQFIPTTLQVGASLYDGLNPTADGGSNMAFVEPMAARQRSMDAKVRTEQSDSFEYRLDHRMREDAMEFAATNPSRAVELAAIKFLCTWNIWPNEPGLRSWPLRLAVAATYLPLLILGLWGAIKFSKRGWPYILCWLPLPYFALLHMIFVGSIRYREPAMIALIPLAAGVVSECWAKSKPRVARLRRPTLG